MGKTISRIVEIRDSLKEMGYETYSNMLRPYIEKSDQKRKYVIGIAGDDLVGKSSVINSVLGKDILPVNVIPSNAGYVIRYGESDKVAKDNGETVPLSELDNMSDEETCIQIEVNSSYLKEGNVEIVEFNGLLNLKSVHDISLMTELYRCDAVALVLSAEHLFSETECRFIENYIQYAGVEHLILIVNKLSMIDKNDVGNVLNYAIKQAELKFPQAELVFIESTISASNGYLGCTAEQLQEKMLSACVSDEKRGMNPAENMLQYIEACLEKDKENLIAELGRTEEERKKHNEQLLRQKAMEEAAIEEALLDFQQRRNLSSGKINEFIKQQFNETSATIIAKFEETDNKVTWYESELNNLWRRSVQAISGKADAYALEIFEEDIAWLNNVIKTKLNMDSVKIGIPDRTLSQEGEFRPYGKYKKYVPIGVGGGVVISFCLFKIVGAVICLGGGALLYAFLGAKEVLQTEDMKRSIESGIGDIFSEVRRVSQKEIEHTYKEVLDAFEKEARSVIVSKYAITEAPDDIGFKDKIERLNTIIKSIKEG